MSLTSVLDGVGGQRHTSAALPPGKERYPLSMRLGGPLGWSRRVRKILPRPRFELCIDMLRIGFILWFISYYIYIYITQSWRFIPWMMTVVAIVACSVVVHRHLFWRASENHTNVMEDNTLGANFPKHVHFGKNGAVWGETCVVLCASGVAVFFFSARDV